MSAPIYTTGLVSIATGTTSLTQVGGVWTEPTVYGGDLIQFESGAVYVLDEITDPNTAELTMPLVEASIVSETYTIIRLSPRRLMSADVALRVTELLDRLNIAATGWMVGTGVPDDEDDGETGYIYLDDATGDLYGPKLMAGWPASSLNIRGTQGYKGWSPEYAMVVDGVRRVMQLVGYVGGEGTEPTDHVGKYVGLTGYETLIANGVDFRGMVGQGQFQFTFDSSTTISSDPGAGDFRFNHATVASVTGAAFDDLDYSGANIEAAILSWDDGGHSSARGHLLFRKQGTPATFALFLVTGSVTDSSGWTQLTLTHVASNGTWTAADVANVDFFRAGPASTGDVVGPGAVTAGNPVVWSGTTGLLVAQVTFAAFKTSLALVKGDVGLGNVDNTADTAKPVSTAQQTALDLKANLASPTLTGTPAAPTATPGTNTTQVATTAFVTTADNLKANLASPTLTGTPAAPTATPGTNSTQIATTAYADAIAALKANLASPTFTGTPAAPTAAALTSTTQIATTAFVTAAVSAIVAAADAMVFKGVTDASANPNYPAGDRGDTYRISVAGKIGGASGVNVEIGDLIICLTDGTAAGNQATVGASWTIAQGNVDGGVIGPASAVDNTPAVYDGATGKLLKNITYAAFKTAASLDNVNNTSDANKPVSTAQQTALDLKANLASPALTGTPTAPTPSPGDNDTSIATTAFVTAAIAVVAAGTFSFVIEAASFNPTITNGMQRYFAEDATNDLIEDSLAADTSTQEFATTDVTMPAGWDGGTITVQPAWRGTGSAAQTVVWGFSAVAVSNDDAMDAAPGTAQTSTDTWLADGDLHVGPATSAITIAGTPATGNADRIRLKASRNPASDTLSGDARLQYVIVTCTLV